MKPDNEQLFARHLPALQRFLRARRGRLLAAQEDTADLAQSTYRVLLQDLARRSPGGDESFERWVYRAAENKLRDRGRYNARLKREAARRRVLDSSPLAEPASPQPSPSERACARELAATLQTALETLPPSQREVVELARFEGLGHGEIAQRTGRSTVATRTLLHRGLARLGRELDRAGPA